jgi:hypothetical protein
VGTQPGWRRILVVIYEAGGELFARGWAKALIETNGSHRQVSNETYSVGMHVRAMVRPIPTSIQAQPIAYSPADSVLSIFFKVGARELQSFYDLYHALPTLRER